MELIQQQLDQLVVLGRKNLLHRTKVFAHQHALPIAGYLLLPVSFCGLVAQFFINIRLAELVWFWLVWILVPLLGYASAFTYQLIGHHISRKQALALYDDHLHLADRLQIADEFLALKTPSGFQLAAIEDSQRAIAQALTTPIPKLASIKITLTRGSKFAVIISVALLLLLALFNITGPILSDGLGSGAAFANTDDTSLVVNSSSKQALTAVTTSLTETQSAAVDSATTAQSSKIADAAKNTSSSKNDSNNGRGAAAADNGIASAQMSAAARVQTVTAAKASSPQLTPRQQLAEQRPLLSSMTPSASTASSQSQSDAQANSKTQDSGAEQQADAQQENSVSSMATAQDENNRQDETNQKGAMGASRSAAQQGKPAQKKQDSGAKKKNNQQQSGGSQQNNNSNNSQNQGDDAQKKSHGINQLMLSVPMPDQFIGTPGPGPEQQQMRNVQPSEQPNVRLPSQGRGENEDSLSVKDDHMAEPWEIKLLSKFYHNVHAEKDNKDNSIKEE